VHDEQQSAARRLGVDDDLAGRERERRSDVEQLRDEALVDP